MLFSAILSSRPTPYAAPVASFPTYFAPRVVGPSASNRVVATAPQPTVPREERDLDQLVREIGEW